MLFTCHHWRSDDIFFEEERDVKQHKAVEKVEDFIDGAVFYVSFRGPEFYPKSLNQSGYVYELEIEINKVYICSTFDEYVNLTNIDESDGYLLYKINIFTEKLIEKGFDLIVRGDRVDELTEGFLVNPKKSVKNITFKRIE